MSVYAYQITADSGCDLSLEKCAERGVMPYKMPFTMDGKPMTDGMTEESFREFYDLMRAGGIARTSQINPGEFTEFWRPLAEVSCCSYSVVGAYRLIETGEGPLVS